VPLADQPVADGDRPTTRPLVSVLVTAFNLGRFLGRALDSALEQSLSPEQVEIVVVDDGSTDETPAVLASYGSRVHVIRQENRGVDMAVDRGLRELTGEFISLLDADDIWPADKLARQVEFLQANPAVGLVHGDMTVIDAHEAILKESFFEDHGIEPTRGRILGRLLCGNFISGGALMFRGELLPAILPIPPEVAYHDWTIAASVAAIAEIDHLPGTFNLYRLHGANGGLGRGREEYPRILRGEIRWRRWMFNHLSEDATVSSAQLRAAWEVWESSLRAAGSDGSYSVTDLVPVSQHERRRGQALASSAAQALREEEHELAARLLLRALAEDPFNGGARADLMLQMRAERRPAILDPPLLTQLGGRSRFTLAFAQELLEHDELLRAYVRNATTDTQTLVILNTSPQQARGLAVLVGELALDGQAPIEVLAATARTTPARRLLADRARTVLSLQPPPEYTQLPLEDCLRTMMAGGANSSHQRSRQT
jgi:glycosyltransferase involved in cell wall biosynthesis